MQVHPSLLARIQMLLKNVAHASGDTSSSLALEAERLANAIHMKSPKLKKKLPGKSKSQRRREKAVAHAQSTAEIIKDVWARSAGSCESCGKSLCPIGSTFGESGELDHHLGGSGRRRQMQSAANCWRICRYCHTNRTFGIPSGEFWREKMATFREALAWAPSSKP